MRSNAGFLFLSTALRLAALWPKRSGQELGEVPAATYMAHNFPTAGQHTAASAVAAEEADAAAAEVYLGRMDAVIFDSAPAPITADMAAR